MPDHLWLPYFEQHDATAIGDEWPTYVVEKWERNEIGETRFTGESRTYGALDAALARERDYEEEIAHLTEQLRRCEEAPYG